MSHVTELELPVDAYAPANAVNENKKEDEHNNRNTNAISVGTLHLEPSQDANVVANKKNDDLTNDFDLIGYHVGERHACKDEDECNEGDLPIKDSLEPRSLKYEHCDQNEGKSPHQEENVVEASIRMVCIELFKQHSHVFIPVWVLFLVLVFFLRRFSLHILNVPDWK